MHTFWFKQSPNFICFSNFFSLSLKRVSCCWFVPWNIKNIIIIAGAVCQYKIDKSIYYAALNYGYMWIIAFIFFIVILFALTAPKKYIIFTLNHFEKFRRRIKSDLRLSVVLLCKISVCQSWNIDNMMRINVPLFEWPMHCLVINHLNYYICVSFYFVLTVNIILIPLKFFFVFVRKQSKNETDTISQFVFSSSSSSYNPLFGCCVWTVIYQCVLLLRSQKPQQFLFTNGKKK